MSLPLTRRDGLAYVLTYEDEKVELRFDYLRRRSGDEVKGEISIKTLLPTDDPQLHESEIRLTSANSREAIVRKLKRRIANIDWERLIDQGCVAVVRDFRKGEMARMVGNMPGRNPPQYQVYPLLLEKDTNLIFGPGGSGKSKLACFLAALVKSGMPSCHLQPVQGNVLYLDYETTQEEVDETIKQIKAGMCLEEELEIVYRRCIEPIAADANEIKRIVLEREINFVIIDSVGYAIGGDMESSELVLNYFTALRFLGVTTLSIDHVTHVVRGRPYGSVYKVNAARSMWEVIKTQEPGESIMVLGLHHRKANNSQIHSPMGFKFTFSEEGDKLDIDSTDIAEHEGQVEHLTVTKRMELLLLKDSMKAKEIAEAIGTTEESVRVLLSANKHRFRKLGDGYWGVATIE